MICIWNRNLLINNKLEMGPLWHWHLLPSKPIINLCWVILQIYMTVFLILYVTQWHIYATAWVNVILSPFIYTMHFLSIWFFFFFFLRYWSNVTFTLVIGDVREQRQIFVYSRGISIWTVWKHCDSSWCPKDGT